MYAKPIWTRMVKQMFFFRCLTGFLVAGLSLNCFEVFNVFLMWIRYYWIRKRARAIIITIITKFWLTNIPYNEIAQILDSVERIRNWKSINNMNGGWNISRVVGQMLYYTHTRWYRYAVCNQFWKLNLKWCTCALCM